MMSFKEVLKTTLSYKEARKLAIISVSGIISAAVIPFLFGDSAIATMSLVGICMLSFVTIEQFCQFFRAIRIADMEAHDKQVYKREKPRKRK